MLINNSFFNKLSPKETKFYSMLEELAFVISEISKLITESVSNYKYNESIEYFKKIKNLEKQGDKTITQIFDAFNTTFITPFDREDIHELANILDDVADYMNNAAKRIVLYHPKTIPNSAVQLGNLLIEATGCLYKAIAMLPTLKKDATEIKNCCDKLHSIENKADDVYEFFIKDLFENATDAIEIIKLKDILYELENATDAAEDAGNIIKTIIVKYA